jgi:hypothetical protein
MPRWNTTDTAKKVILRRGCLDPKVFFKDNKGWKTQESLRRAEKENIFSLSSFKWKYLRGASSMPFYPQGRLDRAQESLDSIVWDERADHGTGRMIDARDNVGPRSSCFKPNGEFGRYLRHATPIVAARLNEAWPCFSAATMKEMKPEYESATPQLPLLHISKSAATSPQLRVSIRIEQ